MEAAADLPALLRLEKLDDWHFQSRHNAINGNGRIYGGQMLGQALWAAGQTAPDRRPTQFQLMYGSGASADVPLDFAVDTVQEGRRFSTRRIGLAQSGKLLATAAASFQLPMDGPSHQIAMQSAPDPETLLSLYEQQENLREQIDPRLIAAFRLQNADIRPINFEEAMAPMAEPRVRFWLRFDCGFGDDPLLHASALAYASDSFTGFAAIASHAGFNGLLNFYVAALSHAIWFHRPFRADDWLLFDSTSPSTGGGQGLVDVRVFDRAGALVASVALNMLISQQAGAAAA